LASHLKPVFVSVSAAMIILSDNDILLKLAAFDLLEAAFLMFENHEVYVLATAPYSIRAAKTVRDNSPEAIERAAAFIASCRKLPAAPHEEDNDALLDVEGIDSGEAILFSSMRDFDNAVLVTGDKRSLKALARSSSGTAVRKLLHGKVICLEEVVRALILVRGFEFVKSHIVPARNCDKVMLIVFGSGLHTQGNTALAALSAYITDLNRLLGKIGFFSLKCRDKIARRVLLQLFVEYSIGREQPRNEPVARLF